MPDIALDICCTTYVLYNWFAILDMRMNDHYQSPEISNENNSSACWTYTSFPKYTFLKGFKSCHSITPIRLQTLYPSFNRETCIIQWNAKSFVEYFLGQRFASPCKYSSHNWSGFSKLLYQSTANCMATNTPCIVCQGNMNFQLF